MTKSIKILFLAANPKNTTQLRLDKEIRDIKQALLQSKFGENFNIEQEWAVQISDLQAHLLRHKPDIVHFSGHGNESSEIILENSMGVSQAVPTKALSQLFSIIKKNIRCVILNACYSNMQAKGIAEHIDYVIGISKEISDSAAISFAVAFYQALGFGEDIKTAFNLGKTQIDLEGLNEQDTLTLLNTNNQHEETKLLDNKLISERSDSGTVQKAQGKYIAQANNCSTSNIIINK